MGERYGLTDADIAAQVAFMSRCYAAIAAARKRGEVKSAAEWFERARVDRLELEMEPEEKHGDEDAGSGRENPGA